MRLAHQPPRLYRRHDADLVPTAERQSGRALCIPRGYLSLLPSPTAPIVADVDGRVKQAVKHLDTMPAWWRGAIPARPLAPSRRLARVADGGELRARVSYCPSVRVSECPSVRVPRASAAPPRRQGSGRRQAGPGASPQAAAPPHGRWPEPSSSGDGTGSRRVDSPGWAHRRSE